MEKCTRKLMRKEQKEVCLGQKRGSKKKNERRKKQTERQHSWRLTGMHRRRQSE